MSKRFQKQPIRHSLAGPIGVKVKADLQNAVALHQRGHLAEAERIYREILKAAADFFEATHLLGVVLLQRRQLVEAEQLLARARKLNPKDPNAHCNHGLALHELGRFEEAVSSYDRSVALRPDAEVLSDRGNVLQKLRRFEEAVASYDRAIALKPGFADAFSNRGVALKELKRFDEALTSCDKAIALKPDFAEAFSNRGNVLQELRRLDEALASYDRATALQPDYAEAFSNRGQVLQELRRLDEALASYDRAIALRPNLVEAFSNRGNVLQLLKRLDEALASHDRAIALRPDYAEAYSNRGKVLQELKRFDEALASHDRAIALRPDYAEAFSNRGNVLQELKRLDEALASYDSAIALRPDYAEALSNRGNDLQELNRLDEALASYDRAIALMPDYAEAFSNRGNALQKLKRLEEAVASYDQAIALKPGFADAFSNRGAALKELKRFDEALTSFDQAITLRPDHADGYSHRAHCRLLVGRYEEGWNDYEWRSGAEDPQSKQPDLKVPTWQNEELSGRHLLVFSEQGLGDVLQFVRYLLFLTECTRKITFLGPERLTRLLRPSLEGVDIVSTSDNVQGVDFQIALMSLPHRFKTKLASIPNKVPYLRPEAELEARWQVEIDACDFKIGIAWQGNPRGKIDEGRSIPLEQFVPLSRISGVRLISLQKHVGLDQLSALPKDIEIETLGDDFDKGPDAFIDTAAVMSSLDLIITSDTSVAHLAGALGRPAWVALKHVPDWRWLLDREDSPWYPTLRLFRQPKEGDWVSVFANIEQELRALVGENKP